MSARADPSAEARPRKAPGLRERKQLTLMRRLQARALQLFERRGFDAVTIEEIAAACEVSPQTVYRRFGAKEQLILWDEHDPMLFAAVRQHLPDGAIEAARRGLIAGLDSIYARDAQRLLRRARLLDSSPTVAAANVAALESMRRALSDLFVTGSACRDKLEADVAASVVVGTLEIAGRHWVHAKGRKPLRFYFDEAFGRLTSLVATRQAGRARRRRM